MPNLCSNTITIRTKTRKRLLQVLKELRGTNSEGKRVALDFNSIIPIDLKDKEYWGRILEFTTNDGYKCIDGDSDFSGNFKVTLKLKTLKWKRCIPIKDYKDGRWGFKYKSIYLVGYCFDWYKWANVKWGVKWNAMYPTVTKPHRVVDSDGYIWSTTIDFDTPWDKPTPVLQALCKKYYEDCKLSGTYCEPGNMFQGEWQCGDDGEFYDEESFITLEDDDE